MAFRENIKWQYTFPLLLILASLLFCLPLTASAGGGQKTFTSPEKAVGRLVSAVKSQDVTKLVDILGPGFAEIVSFGETVAVELDWQEFLEMYREKHSIDRVGSDRAVLLLGERKFPFPFPLRKKGNRWSFDSAAGTEEVLNRCVGRGELNAIQVAHVYVDAQRQYAMEDRDGDGLLAFAQKFRSLPGKNDGLYWKNGDNGEEESLLGPLIARAAEGESPLSGSETPQPYHGYYFRILTAQGETADGGAYSYIVNNKMLLGFALIAYPAQYGCSGIMSFIVNQSGVVYQKDLGPDSTTVARTITLYMPDASWEKVE
jgi:hypothetical protein